MRISGPRSRIWRDSATDGAVHGAAAVGGAPQNGAVPASHDDTTAAQSAGYGVRLAAFSITLAAAPCAPRGDDGGAHPDPEGGAVWAIPRLRFRRRLFWTVSRRMAWLRLWSFGFRLAALGSDLPRVMATVTSARALAGGLADRGCSARAPAPIWCGWPRCRTRRLCPKPGSRGAAPPKAFGARSELRCAG